ncbi:pirin family protein [Euzebya tangerina]|uniref:pirin family protein n=1 Tax=Euzebya tangerina TaxID=591198 RepID=UPI0013C2D76F|nr:pirin family protein [Euzebya tangerina]
MSNVLVSSGRTASLPGVRVVRVLPVKGRRTIGPWCFVDQMLPPEVEEPDPMEIGPHPHIGLQTVTWLFEGEAVHGDSLGTEQTIRPGQLNLMTAGRGIAHAELGLGAGLRGVQMWVAQPEETRHGAPAFEHHADLPVLDLAAGPATVFVGTLRDADDASQTSPARHDTPSVGAELRLGTGSVTLPAEDGFEYAVVPTDHPVEVNSELVAVGELGYIAPGDDHLHLQSTGENNRIMLLGGEPIETISMWWNFVARNHDEITEAFEAWQAHDTDRFGTVPSDLERMDAPTPPWLRG